MRIENVIFYVCETCGRRFSTIDECVTCERSHGVVKRVELHFHTSTGDFSIKQETVPKAAVEVVAPKRLQNSIGIYWYIECDGTDKSLTDAIEKLRHAAAIWFYDKSQALERCGRD